jgi:hypothetical protein
VQQKTQIKQFLKKERREEEEGRREEYLACGENTIGVLQRRNTVKECPTPTPLGLSVLGRWIPGAANITSIWLASSVPGGKLQGFCYPGMGYRQAGMDTGLDRITDLIAAGVRKMSIGQWQWNSITARSSRIFGVFPPSSVSFYLSHSVPPQY